MDKIWGYIKIHYRGILNIISLLCIGLLVLWLLTKPPQIPTATQKTIDSLKAANIELSIRADKIDTSLKYFNVKIDGINKKLDFNSSQQQSLKLEYDKKINNIGSFSSDDVYNYILHRYSTDTSKK